MSAPPKAWYYLWTATNKEYEHINSTCRATGDLITIHHKWKPESLTAVIIPEDLGTHTFKITATDESLLPALEEALKEWERDLNLYYTEEEERWGGR